MKLRTRLVPFTLVALLCSSGLTARTPAAPAPKLVVLVVVDQMRADYLQHYDGKITAGFRRLLTGGAVFSQAYYPYASTETAQGHSTMASGQPPSTSGIVGDSWYDKPSRANITAGDSPNHRLLDGSARGGSPEQLLVHTIGDIMKERDRRTLVLTASWKRYAADLMGGQHADAAYWFDSTSGHMVTSDYYLRTYPAWVDAYNATDPSAQYFGKEWLGHKFSTRAAPDTAFRDALHPSPYPNDMLLEFSTRLLANTQIGRDDVTDFLGVSFSDVDYVGHSYGPDTPEMDEVFVQMDRQLGAFMQALDQHVGDGNWAMVLCADHGAPELPEKLKARGVDAGRIATGAFRTAVVKELSASWPDADRLIEAFGAPEFYLDYPEAVRQGGNTASLEHAVRAAAEKQPGIARVYTRSEILAAGSASSDMLRAIASGFNPSRSGDIYLVVKPNYFFGAPNTGISHGSLYDYDRHVPLIFYGAGVAKGTKSDRVLVNDLAPTLASLAGVTLPGVPGHVLSLK